VLRRAKNEKQVKKKNDPAPPVEPVAVALASYEEYSVVEFKLHKYPLVHK
jgi:hypothetical protein